MKILEGKAAAQAVKDELTEQVNKLKTLHKRVPHLAAILIGNNGASETYVASKIKNCAEVGFQSSLVRLNDNISETELVAEIVKLNQDDKIDGILVQLPL